ncbi:MAG: winged helix-turn-helix domain-containing protein [bacterium]
MDLINPLDAIFGTPSNVKVLRVLADSDNDLTGRQIASLAGLNAMTCQNALNRLRDIGILEVRQAGRAYLYKLKERDHLVSDMLLPLFRKERSYLKDHLGTFSSRLRGVAASAYLMGSSSGDVSGRDICIIVSGETNRDFARRKAEEEIELLGIAPEVTVLTIAELKKLYLANDPLYQAIEDGELLYGTSLSRLI